MSEQQYEIEARMHDTLVAKDKRIEELETRVKELTDLNARLAEPRVRPSDSTIYDEPTYGDY